jgi:uncharacterized protein (TIGR02757 family)
MKLQQTELKEFLDFKVIEYNTKAFIHEDPIRIPHQFRLKEDIEISGFLVATIAWGNRRSIIKSGEKMIQLMGESPYDFVMTASPKQIEGLHGFVHRTFNGDDFATFVKAIRNLYKNQGGFENVFAKHATIESLQPAIHEFKKVFFRVMHDDRTEKHVSDPLKNSAAKKINMWLRWMVRKDKSGVDFGLWKSISSSQLSCPLDVHSGNVARKLGLLKRTQNDAKALAELDLSLRKLDYKDPVKYDFALFGLGVFEKF